MTDNLFVFFVSPIISVLIAFIFELKLFYQLNSNSIKALIYPKHSEINRFSNLVLLFIIFCFVALFVSLVFKNPIFFVPISLVINVVIAYYINYKNIVFIYFQETKLLIWTFSAFESYFSEIELETIEAFVITRPDTVTRLFGNNSIKERAYVNLILQGEQKSLEINLEFYESNAIKSYFSDRRKPIYSKINYEKTATRIN